MAILTKIFLGCSEHSIVVVFLLSLLLLLFIYIIVIILFLLLLSLLLLPCLGWENNISASNNEFYLKILTINNNLI